MARHRLAASSHGCTAEPNSSLPMLLPIAEPPLTALLCSCIFTYAWFRAHQASVCTPLLCARCQPPELFPPCCRPPVYTVRVNQLKGATASELLEQLSEAGVEAEPSPYLPEDFIRIKSGLQLLLAQVRVCPAPVFYIWGEPTTANPHCDLKFFKQ